jgi:hypothetical protein
MFLSRLLSEGWKIVFGGALLPPVRWKLLLPLPQELVALAPLHQHLHCPVCLSLKGVPPPLVGRRTLPPLLLAFPLTPWARLGQSLYAQLLYRRFLPLRLPPLLGLSVRSARLWGHPGWAAPFPP